MNFKHGRRYKLSQDVKNPRLDRRHKSGAALTPWKEGEVFYCCHRSSRVTLGDKRGFCADPIDSSHPGYESLARALVELPESTDDALSCVPSWGPEDASAVLDGLVQQGKVSLEDVRTMVREMARCR